MKRSKLPAAAFALLISLAVGSTALARELTWSGDESGEWNSESNWVEREIPAAGDDVIFTARSGPAMTIELPADVAVRSVFFNGFVHSTYTLTGEGAELNIDPASAKVSNGIVVNAPEAPVIDVAVTIRNSGGGETRIAANESLEFGPASRLIIETPTLLQSGKDATLRLAGAISGEAPTLVVQGGPVEFSGADANTFANPVWIRPAGRLTLAKKSGIDAIAGKHVLVMKSGILAWAADDQIKDATNVALGGGTLATAGHRDQCGSLVVNQDSVIDFAEGGSLEFADSAAHSDAWGSSKIEVRNFDPSKCELRFGTSESGLTASQLASILFEGKPGSATIDSSGLVTPAQ